MRRWRRGLFVILAAAIAGGATTWAGLKVLVPPEDPLDSPKYTYVAVVPGEVGESLMLNVRARWQPSPAGVNRASGVVTRVIAKVGDKADQGTSLYEVGLRPVAVAQGEIPAFRAIEPGSEGDDVAQLQEMLSALGFYDGRSDGEAGSSTVSAIKRWQASLGIEQTGRVEAGDVIFVPELPARVSLDRQIVTRGATLVGGEQVLSVLPTAPVFAVPVTEAQAGMVSPGGRVDITSPDGETWGAVIAGQAREPESSNVELLLEGVEGDPICGEQCADLPVAEDTLLPGRIVLVETSAGLVVPSAALTTDAAGDTLLIDEDGKRISVEVGSSGRGMAVVTGVDEGVRVRVPAVGIEG